MEAQSSRGSQSLDSGDFEPYVSVGYMGMGGSTAFSQVNGAISFMGGMIGLSQSGVQKFGVAAMRDAIVADILTALWGNKGGIFAPRTLLSRFLKDSNGHYLVNPFGKPDFTEKGVKKMNASVDGFEDAYKLGREPVVTFDLKSKDLAGYTHTYRDVQINKSNVENNYQYAALWFHEYRHFWQYQPNDSYKYGSRFGQWVADHGSGSVYDYAERDAYWFQIMMGGGDTLEGYMRYEAYRKITIKD